jgi:hypothetical protein
MTACVGIPTDHSPVDKSSIESDIDEAVYFILGGQELCVGKTSGSR